MARIYEDLDPNFAVVCSDVTLFSNNKGFFKNVADEIVSIAESDKWLEILENTNDDEKIKAVLKNETIMEALKEILSRIQPIFRSKDARISHERRVMAEAALKEGDVKKSLALATQAVLRAPMTGTEEIFDDGVSLALALWQRSDILLRLNRATAALEDLKLALKERLPARMRAEYYWRMGHCYKGTGEPTRAKVSYELAGRLLGNNDKAKIQLAQDIDAIDYTIKPKFPPDKPGVVVTGGTKQNLPALSKLVKIIEEEDKGRFAVANAEIKTGDVLLVDSPYAACLLSDFYGTHCLHCFKRFDNFEDVAPVWCPSCSGVAFCSTTCRDAAVSTYHLYECQFLDLFIGSGMSILSHIALRMITQAGIETSLQIHTKYLSSQIKTVESTVLNDIEGTKKNKLKSRKERLNRSKKGLKSFENKNLDNESETKVEDKTNYHETLEMKAGQIYALCTHSSQRKGADYLKRIVMALFLTECLKKGDFFKSCSQENLCRAENVTCELIVRNLQLLQFNAHEIYETVRGQHQFSGSKPIYVAVGIYPAGALFNHECYPAVARLSPELYDSWSVSFVHKLYRQHQIDRIMQDIQTSEQPLHIYFENQKIVLRATRPLQPGEVVSENYGPHFLVRGLKERQRMLSCRYWFRCECIACKENWPTLKEMGTESSMFYRCPNRNCMGKFAFNRNFPNRCPKCSTCINEDLKKEYSDDVEKCLLQYQEGAILMDEERPKDAIAILSEAVNRFHRIARPPHKETHIAQESLRSCFAADSNVYIVNMEKSKN